MAFHCITFFLNTELKCITEMQRIFNSMCNVNILLVNQFAIAFEVLML